MLAALYFHGLMARGRHGCDVCQQLASPAVIVQCLLEGVPSAMQEAYPKGAELDPAVGVGCQSRRDGIDCALACRILQVVALRLEGFIGCPCRIVQQ